MARNLLTGSDFKKVLVFNIPKKRAFMHLDTVFTMVDYDKFSIHPEIEGPSSSTSSVSEQAETYT